MYKGLVFPILTLVLLVSGCKSTAPKSATSPDGTKSTTQQSTAYLEGGIVEVGGYKNDGPHWGLREAFAKPFYIDTQPTPLNFKAFRDCMTRKGRLPEEFELNYALKLGKVEAGNLLEVTQSDVNAEGTLGGQYNARLLGLEKLVIIRPGQNETKGGFQRRCLVPVDRTFDNGSYVVLEDVKPKNGRSDKFQNMEVTLKKDQIVNLFYRDNAWVLVDLGNDGPDSGGWVPSSKIRAK